MSVGCASLARKDRGPEVVLDRYLAPVSSAVLAKVPSCQTAEQCAEKSAKAPAPPKPAPASAPTTTPAEATPATAAAAAGENAPAPKADPGAFDLPSAAPELPLEKPSGSVSQSQAADPDASAQDPKGL
jgi:hypothetical protein